MENLPENNMDQKEKVNLNKTWILVAVLVAITGGLLIISITSKNIVPSPTPSKEIPEETANTILEISSDVRQGSSSAKKQVDLTIATNGDKVTITQLELSYDPTLLTNVDIAPGSFFLNPKILQKEINPGTGRITYWLGDTQNQKGNAGGGTLAVISFTKVGSSPAQISFLPKTSIQAFGIDQSVLKNAIPGIINNFIHTPTKTPARLNSSSSAQTTIAR